MTEPWKLETENRLDWEFHGYHCALRRNEWGSWCGYVGITSTNPLFKLGMSEPSEYLNARLKTLNESYMDDKTPVISIMLEMLTNRKLQPTPAITLKVHGGITWADCHILYNPEDDNIWWFGFDCAHSTDLSPYLKEMTEISLTIPEIREFYDNMTAMLRTALGGDFNPDLEHYEDERTYRTMDYAKNETEELAQQLREIEDWTHLTENIKIAEDSPET